MSAQPEAGKVAEGFIRYLEEAGRINLLPEIVKNLAAKVAADHRRVIVTSRLPLNEKQKERINSYVFSKAGADGEISFETSEEVIGGIKIRIGDELIDATIKNRLALLGETLVGKIK